MIRGYIDCINGDRQLEGWAFDVDQPALAVEIEVRRDDRVVAAGLAHRFRADLMRVGYGVGWCGFRLRMAGEAASDDGDGLRLVAPDGTEIHAARRVQMRRDGADNVATDASLADPLMIEGIWQLEGCGSIFDGYIGRHGLPTFLVASYAYVLGRPADESGLSSYEREVREGVKTPFSVLEALCASDEFRSRARSLPAPSNEAFPFLY